MPKPVLFFLVSIALVRCAGTTNIDTSPLPVFPSELVSFQPYKGNPVLQGTQSATWDNQIRERGWILREGKNWYLWYTGYTNIDSIKYLGYATSRDGYLWKRFEGNPIYKAGWVEDMCVVKSAGTYYMFAEGKGDTAHMLVSADRIHWREAGNLDIRLSNGDKLPKGPYGTPTVIKDKNMWYLFYERDDTGIWLAKSKDMKTWINVQDQPVLSCGPEVYDRFAVAMDQVIKYKGSFYGFYHASADKDWHEWSSDIAVSTDLIHWKKYSGNPIVDNDKSSPILIYDGHEYRLYTMHPEINVFLPSSR